MVGTSGGVDRDVWCFFFQAEDGIRGAQESRGLGDVYKRQAITVTGTEAQTLSLVSNTLTISGTGSSVSLAGYVLSLIHI